MIIHPRARVTCQENVQSLQSLEVEDAAVVETGVVEVVEGMMDRLVIKDGVVNMTCNPSFCLPSGEVLQLPGYRSHVSGVHRTSKAPRRWQRGREGQGGQQRQRRLQGSG